MNASGSDIRRFLLKLILIVTPIGAGLLWSMGRSLIFDLELFPEDWFLGLIMGGALFVMSIVLVGSVVVALYGIWRFRADYIFCLIILVSIATNLVLGREGYYFAFHVSNWIVSSQVQQAKQSAQFRDRMRAYRTFRSNWAQSMSPIVQELRKYYRKNGSFFIDEIEFRSHETREGEAIAHTSETMSLHRFMEYCSSVDTCQETGIHLSETGTKATVLSNNGNRLRAEVFPLSQKFVFQSGKVIVEQPVIELTEDLSTEDVEKYDRSTVRTSFELNGNGPLYCPDGRFWDLRKTCW